MAHRAKWQPGSARPPADAALLLYLLTRWLPVTIWGFAMALILANGDSPLVSKMNSLLNRPSLLFVGKISYSTYLIHYLILWLAKALVACVAPDANPFVVALALFALVPGPSLAPRAVHPSRSGAHQLVRPWYINDAPDFEVRKTVIASGTSATPAQIF
jgi:hypothetical protein